MTSLEILGLFRACGPEKRSEKGSKYQIGSTWLHFIQGHFLLKTIHAEDTVGGDLRFFDDF